LGIFENIIETRNRLQIICSSTQLKLMLKDIAKMSALQPDFSFLFEIWLELFDKMC
jgi:hypothetical protein